MRVSEIDVGDVGAWPAWMKAVAHVAVVACVLGLGHWLVFGEQRRELASLARTGSEWRQSLVTKSQAAGHVARAEQHRAYLESTLAAAQRQLPRVVDLPTLIEELGRTAVDSGLVIESIHVSDDEPQDDYVAMPIALVVTGSYHQFGAFVSAAADLEHLLTFHDFEIEPRGRPLTLTLAGRSYRAVDGADEDAERFDAAPPATGRVRAAYSGSGRSPFEVGGTPRSPDPHPEVQGKQPLERFALARLQMVGVLARREVSVALVRDPTGRVHRAGTGDRVGLHGGRVTSVEFDGMEIVETRSDHTTGWARRVHRMEPGPRPTGAPPQQEAPAAKEEEE